MNSSPDPTANKRIDIIIITVLVISFSIGTVTHSIDTIKLGFFGYSKLHGATIWHTIFWTSLLFIDPIIIILLIVNRKVGAVAGFIVLVVDVIVNHYYLTDILGAKSWETPSFSLQVACLIFSALSLPKLLTYNSSSTILNKGVFLFYSKMPLAVLFLGILIHVKGLIFIFITPMSFWEMWVHFFMLFFNVMLFYLVVKNFYIGFWIGVVAFSIWALIQIGFAIGSFISSEIPFNVPMGIYLAVCCLTVLSFLHNKNKMVEKIGIMKL